MNNSDNAQDSPYRATFFLSPPFAFFALFAVRCHLSPGRPRAGLAGSRRGTGDFNRKERKERKGKAGSTTAPMKKPGLAVRCFTSVFSLRSLRSLR
ncbi:MAG: hypothetical protein NTX87_08575 [Planctomycetota bacterium]|nr:hypothetical protein [Planctomycetota bacterium]